MMMWKRVAAAAAAVLVSVTMLAGCGNTAVFNSEYDYAYILMPNGDIVEGTVESWRDYTAGYLQITINGVTYLTGQARAVMVHYEKEKTE